MRSLINYDPSNKLIDSSQPAGGAPNLLVSANAGNREEVQAGLFYARKRMDVKKKIEMRIGSDDPVRTGKRLVDNSAAPGSGGPMSLSQAFKASSQMSELLVDRSEPPVLLSHAQVDMRRGQLGSSDLAENIRYTSEQRILREQVLAALRKLDAGELSSVEFQDKMFTMGVELPLTVLRELSLYQQSGLLNWSACVQALDGYVFKHKSVEPPETDIEDEAAPLRQQMMEAIFNKNGPSGLSDITVFFRQLDEDNSSTLSYNEFLKGCRDFGLRGLTDAQFRVLFNSFDKNGDGSLSFEEFIATLRGPLPQPRKNILMTAFRKIDRRGQHEVSFDGLKQGYDPSLHPDVLEGRKTENMVYKDMYKVFNIEVY
jgi:Ca2+-binding EF-hand superfamily protein